MAVNVNEAIQKIKAAGTAAVRAIPMPGQNVNSGNYQIEINQAGVWTAVASGISKKIAEDIISQATNRVILG
jgi:uncharacterized sporulation protein YeaH/YhbH (DUF444 family)